MGVSLVPENLDVLGTETGHCERGFICYALLQIVEKLLLVSLCVCLSVRPHGAIWLSPDEFS